MSEASDRAKRAKLRRQNATIQTHSLHDENNHSFHALCAEDSWELLAKLSQESYLLQTGLPASNVVDKSKVSIGVK